ncbi:882_t:CDS:1, partial [Racocetra persica]
YTIVDDNDNPLAEHDKTSLHIKVQVGDIVELNEISNPNNISFALVKVIITHRANNGK